ncbi:thioredoxin family protein [Wenyingzhuangia sp. IMCC45533]
MKKLALLLAFIPVLLFSSNPKPKEVNWVSFEEAIALNKKNPKPIIVDVFTDWCHWCKVMDKKTYTNTTIIEYINKNFYAVKFDAEQKTPVNFNGHTFNFVQSGRRGYHEFAQAMLNGKLSYPSTVFFDSKQQLVYVAPGYLKTPIMEKLINFMYQEKYINSDWETFEKEFKSQL